MRPFLLSSVALVLLAAAPAVRAASCPETDTGITLPSGFCATVFADNLGHVRQMVVSPDNVLYANSWSGRYYHNDTPPAGGFLLALKDSKGAGRADVIERFGGDKSTGSNGGTGVYFYKDAVYAEINDRIVRYARKPGEAKPGGQEETVISGMPMTGDHPMHPFIIGAKGDLFVDMGSATNACQSENRMLTSPGIDPCTELETRAGIWRYDANKTNQPFSAKERYATGLRNGEGFAFDAKGDLFVTQHGRDQLSQNWPKLYTVEEGADLPAEEVVKLTEGADFGWPECYYDQNRKKLVLAPEYGGDGGKKLGVCEKKQAPAAAFPAHFAPNALLIYQGDKFPKAWRDGIFVAFHGSWNRAPRPQGGYDVMFQPMKDGKATGEYIVFADGFAGAHMDPGRAAHRPTGLAVGPDGALYISDDVHGRIWRVTYQGESNAKIASAPKPAGQGAGGSDAQPPEGTHADAGRVIANLPLPEGATREQVALGDRIFHGEEKDGTCSGCHGSDANGTSVGPSLSNGIWVQSDGSLAGITKIIESGVPKPRNYSGVMPPKGGSQLSDQEVAAVAAYVWAVGHAQAK